MLKCGKSFCPGTSTTEPLFKGTIDPVISEKISAARENVAVCRPLARKVKPPTRKRVGRLVVLCRKTVDRQEFFAAHPNILWIVTNPYAPVTLSTRVISNTKKPE
jgi:hypothetical protein